jgi:hypothetical protein
MRREAEFFADEELVLIYIASRLKDALALEALLDSQALDYVVVPEPFTSGVLFRSTRMGAFFYVAPRSEALVRDLMLRRGFKPYIPN